MSRERIKVIIQVIVFLVCLALIIIGQKNIGVTGLLTMLLGLSGLLGLLYVYNKKYA